VDKKIGQGGFFWGWQGEHQGKKGIRTPVLNPHHVLLLLDDKKNKQQSV